MQKRKGFCLLPVFLFVLFFIGIAILIIIIVFALISELFFSPTAGDDSFEKFEQELVEEYDISYADIYIDSDAIEVYFSTVDPVTLDEAREIMEITRSYMSVYENYEPYLEEHIWMNGDEPESVRIRFEPLLSTEFYYQFTAESFNSTYWIFESNIDNNYYYEEYEVFDFIKSIFNKIYI